MKPKLCFSAAALLAAAVSSVILIFVPNFKYTGQINHKLLTGAGDDRNFTLQFRRQQEIEFLPIGEGAIGPETFAFGGDGGPFTGVSDGRVLRWVGDERRWIDFAVTSPTRKVCEGLDPPRQEEMEHICGRPLGLEIDQSNGYMYIADAYKGLLRVGPEGGLATPIVTRVDGAPLVFTNGLDVDQSSGIVYFTDSSSRFQRRHHTLIVLSGDSTGRFMKYDSKTRKATQLASNLMFPNGVALTHDGQSILVVETTNGRVLKYDIESGELRLFAQLDGYPDNIRRSPRGGYWVGMYSKRTKLLEWVTSNHWIGKSLTKLVPFGVIHRVHSYLGEGNLGLGVRLSEDGETLEGFNESGEFEELKSISEVMEKDGELWVGSVDLPFAAKVCCS
ncbi:Protein STRICTOSIDINE SYNTHASE-LIKE 2 [Linum grandiflorum]